MIHVCVIIIDIVCVIDKSLFCCLLIFVVADILINFVAFVDFGWDLFATRKQVKFTNKPKTQCVHMYVFMSMYVNVYWLLLFY